MVYQVKKTKDNFFWQIQLCKIVTIKIVVNLININNSIKHQHLLLAKLLFLTSVSAQTFPIGASLAGLLNQTGWQLTSWSLMALSCSSFLAQYRASSSGISENNKPDKIRWQKQPQWRSSFIDCWNSYSQNFLWDHNVSWNNPVANIIWPRCDCLSFMCRTAEHSDIEHWPFHLEPYSQIPINRSCPQTKESGVQYWLEGGETVWKWHLINVKRKLDHWDGKDTNTLPDT